MEYRVVDVFAQRPFTGNPLTVFPRAAGLDDASMQRIAQEINHSETTFCVDDGPPNGAPRVRIYTPRTELPFAGHPTLGTAHVLGAQALDLNVGRIPVRREGDVLWMTQNEVTFGPIDAAALGRAIGTPVLAAEVASAGTPVALARVRDSDAVRAAALDARAYAGPDVGGVYVFCTDGDHDVHARFFGDFVGIPEDAATGSAAGPLAAWLAREGLLGEGRTIAQGVEIGRDSRILVKMEKGRPCVGGRVFDIGAGRLDALPAAR